MVKTTGIILFLTWVTLVTFLQVEKESTAAAPGAMQAAPVAAAPLQFPPTSGTHLVLPLQIHDGDTFSFAWLVQDRCRVFGINAPEITGPQKADGEKSRDFLATLLPLNKPVVIKVYGKEKFGRTLAEPLDADGKSLGQIMCEKGFARAWDGQGAKP